MLKKDFRLPALTSFSNAKSIHTKYAFIKFKKNDLDVSRFGFIVSKKISKSAVTRNRIKRQIRRCFEESLSQIKPGYDMLLIIKSNISEVDKINCTDILESINKKLL